MLQILRILDNFSEIKVRQNCRLRAFKLFLDYFISGAARSGFFFNLCFNLYSQNQSRKIKFELLTI